MNFFRAVDSGGADLPAADAEDNHKYDDILGLPHPVSARHPQMPLIDRAAQFSAFAALAGYQDAIAETERAMEEFIESGVTASIHGQNSCTRE